MWSYGLKKILLIDNTFDPPHGSPEIRAHLEREAAAFGEIQVVAVRAPEKGVPKDLSGFHGAVLSGSKTRIYEEAEWIELEIQAIRDLHQRKIPTLGICYGEQLIAKTLAGEKYTGAAKQSEHGWAEIKKLAPSQILVGLPETFYSFEYHNDEVFSLPSNFRVTAANARCSVQAFDVLDAPMWGLQFHPERSLEAGNRSLDRKLKEDPSFQPLNREEASKLYSEQVARKIFSNFLEVVWKEKK
jgi:GMP synthase (glutamine-hydrolysing)